ncbi:hypothetical protein [Domibacillus robiginosus]|uniref:hypothetical protein n=1 Tax=Domibacillus robiginosus TaxID=1071054 RepID=UPI00067E24E6|nr:hypothetical protein [Domibacillus robiginosus]
MGAIKSLRNKLDELNRQLYREEKRNKGLQDQLRQIHSQENYEITRLNEQIKKLEKEEALFNAKILEKEETIRELHAELEEHKNHVSEKDFYMQVASLKNEIKQKDQEIETQRKRILDLSNHAEQNKEQH